MCYKVFSIAHSERMRGIKKITPKPNAALSI